MEKVGSYEAKTYLPKLLERVSKGEQFTITKHGVPVAKLVPINAPTRSEIEEAIREMEELSQECSLGGLSVREMIEEGRS